MAKIVILFTLSGLLVACSHNHNNEAKETPYAHYEDDEMVGTVSKIDKDNNLLEVDISEWEKRDRSGPDAATDEGYSYEAVYSEQTEIRKEDGVSVNINDLNLGQKILVNPPRDDKEFNGETEEIVLLEMSDEEKYSEVLSHRGDKFDVVVIYNRTIPDELDESLLEDLDSSPVGSWIKYEKNYVVDYKDEFEIENFPVLLVFNDEKMVYKTYDAADLKKFFRDHAEE
ncbi:hypothetical protein [Halobacillus sp. Marseille-P3879]|uniref:hypothetical protein n=1 Tax=Halobacillus sp. Marseille-P3879 TaxID=2045014 RepID=UPI000C7A5F2B|nr:hypothetical protein [Halobacillus sp. Marseille-P3879]